MKPNMNLKIRKTFTAAALMTALAFLITAVPAVAATKTGPLKVFILVGQSNMEGPANVATFDYLGDDPATAPLLKMMWGPDGKPARCDGAWISYLTGANDKNFDLHGKLTAGYGSMWGMDPTKPGDKIGPEFTFGLTMDAALDEPVLIIKAAWGGKSLHTDFRSPSAGPYQLSSFQRENYPRQEGHGIPKDFEQWKIEKAKATGHYYRLMMEHVKKVLADPAKVCPDYDPAKGYELAGFVWLQGFNDMVDGHVYPKHNQPDRFALYSELLATFIRDVRKELSAPKLPFVIGVMGVGGLKDQSADMVAFRKAMAVPAALPEFKSNVMAVETAPFWSDELGAIDEKRAKVSQMRYFLDSKHKDHANADGHMTQEQKNEYLKKFEADLISPAEVALWKRGASNAGYHYLGCAKTFALMGKHFAEANLAMMKQ
jgi:alpha-galactosidase